SEGRPHFAHKIGRIESSTLTIETGGRFGYESVVLWRLCDCSPTLPRRGGRLGLGVAIVSDRRRRTKRRRADHRCGASSRIQVGPGPGRVERHSWSRRILRLRGPALFSSGVARSRRLPPVSVPTRAKPVWLRVAAEV